MRFPRIAAARAGFLMLVPAAALLALLLTSAGAVGGQPPADSPAAQVARATPTTQPDAIPSAVPGVGGGAGPEVAPAEENEPRLPDPPPIHVDPVPPLSDRDDWPVKLTGSVAFTAPVDCGAAGQCQLLLDIWSPVGAGPHPAVVLLRGGPSNFGGRGYLSFFAQQLAHAGFVVYNADFRDLASNNGGYPMAFEDVACAIRYARATEGNYGGDGSLTLVGHSLGGWVGSIVALDPDEFTGGCLSGGSGRPDAFVGLAGNYDLSRNLTDLANFFGGSAAQTAGARALSNPFNYATGSSIPVRLMAGTADTTVNPAASQKLYSFLAAKDWDVTLQMVPGANHMSTMRSPGGQSPALGAVRDAVSAAARDRAIAAPKPARLGGN